jgi:NAD(P)-dependent dehydrogenase (short-subunit alcohol dehydrogenase family)
MNTASEERVALVTGGGGGVGGATAVRLLRNGWRVALCDVNGERLATVSAQLANASHVMTVVADVRSAADCERAVQAVLGNWSRLDFLVNAAGIWTEGPSAEVSEEEWDRVLDVNLKGTFFMCRYAIPALERTEGGIVNLSSDAGLTGFNGTAVYCASKGGVSLVTKALALELAPRGVRVNAICPSDIDTPMLEYQAATYGKGDPAAYLGALLSLYPQGERSRFIKADEVASLIVYLAQPEAAPITGACLSIDFGSTAGK